MERKNDKTPRPKILMTDKERKEFIKEYQATRIQDPNYITTEQFFKKTNSRI